MRYEKRLHGAWVEGADQTALRHLKSGVLRDASSDVCEKDASASPDAFSVAVNFHPELATLLRESRYLDRMGFAIPETALKVTLREDAFVECREALRDMLARYAAATEGLTEVERELLSEKLAELKRSLNPGFKVLNWMSLGILEFVQNCDRAINEFSALVGLVRKNSGIVAGVVAEIASTTALVEPPRGGRRHGLRRVRRVSGNLEAGHRRPAGTQVPVHRAAAGEDRGGGRRHQHGQGAAARVVLRALGGEGVPRGLRFDAQLVTRGTNVDETARRRALARRERFRP
jgi:hypothetical protein